MANNNGNGNEVKVTKEEFDAAIKTILRTNRSMVPFIEGAPDAIRALDAAGMLVLGTAEARREAARGHKDHEECHSYEHGLIEVGQLKGISDQIIVAAKRMVKFSPGFSSEIEAMITGLLKELGLDV